MTIDDDYINEILNNIVGFEVLRTSEATVTELTAEKGATPWGNIFNVKFRSKDGEYPSWAGNLTLLEGAFILTYGDLRKTIAMTIKAHEMAKERNGT